MKTISRRVWVIAAMALMVNANAVRSDAGEWAAGPALGNVLAGSGNSVVVYPYGGGTQLESVNLGAAVTATAFSPNLELFAVTSDGKVWRIKRTEVGSTHPVDQVATISTAPTVAAPVSIVFDEFGSFYVGLQATSTTPAEVRKYTLINGLYQLVLTHLVQCDATVGLWLDLAPVDPADGQQAGYTCGGRQIRILNVALPQQPPGSLTSTSLFKDLQGGSGSARDLRFLPPQASVGLVPSASHVQGGVIVTDDKVIRLLNAVGSQTFSFNLTNNQDSWSRVELAPIAGTFFASQTSTAGVYRFRLAPTLTAQPELTISAGAVTALAVNGGYRSAIYTQLVRLQPPVPPATSSTQTAVALRNTIWENALDITATPTATVRMAVTLHEGRSGESGVPADFNLDLRLNSFSPKPIAVQAYHGRAAFVRDVQTTAEDPTQLSLVSLRYRLMPTLTANTATVLLYQADPVCHLGISCGNPAAVGQMPQQIQREWFQTDELTRTKKQLGCDLMVAIGSTTVSNVLVNPSSPPVKAFILGKPLTVRAHIGDGSTSHCADAVLTISRPAQNGLSAAIVGSSETTLIDSHGLPSVFTDAGGGNCQANVLLRNGTILPSISELYPAETDFQPGRTYNVCVVFKTLQPDDDRTTVGGAFNDACAQIQTKP